MKSDKSDKKMGFDTPVSTPETPKQAVCDFREQEERESTKQAKRRFLAIFEQLGGGCISAITQKAGISRDTYYHWVKKDPSFAERINTTRQHLNDMAEDILWEKVMQHHPPSVRFYLSHRHPKFMPRSKLIVYNNSGTYKTLDELLNEDKVIVSG